MERIIMKKAILGVLISFLFISSAVAAKAPTILFGLKWGDSKETVHEKMQEINLNFITEKDGAMPIPWRARLYSGDVLGYPGEVMVTFADNKLIDASANYDCEGSIAKRILLELSEVLIEKYGKPTEMAIFENGPGRIWELENINTYILIAPTTKDEPSFDIVLNYANLKIRNEMERQRKEELRKQL